MLIVAAFFLVSPLLINFIPLFCTSRVQNFVKKDFPDVTEKAIFDCNSAVDPWC